MKNYLIVRTRTIINRGDLIRIFSYYLYEDANRTLDINKKEALRIIRNSVWWNGKCGWTGDRCEITDRIGEFENFDTYSACEKIATTFVDKYFAEIKPLIK